MLKERQKSILDAVIQEHIRTARPVASQELLRNFRLGISPATVRNEMLALDDLGYLEQPHTSAGRIPTDKGYRFFVDHLPLEFSLERGEERTLGRLRDIIEVEEFIKELGKTISRISGVFTAVGTFENELFYETGFSELWEEPEFHELDCMKSFGRLVDQLDEEVRELLEAMDLEEKIFIGGENPLAEARPYAMFISRWEHPRGFSGFFTMISPKRTNYLKHKALIHSIREISYDR